MAEISTPSALTGMYKYIYGDRLESYLPNVVQLQKEVGFQTAKQLGRAFLFPVLVGTEQGVTFGSGDADALELNSGISMQSLEANVNGSSVISQGKIGYLAANKARTSKQAFENTVGLKVKELTSTTRKAVEVSLWTGGSELGQTINSGTVTNVGNAGALWSGTITFASGTTAPGYWTGQQNMGVVFAKGNTAGSAWAGGYGGLVGGTTNSTNLQLTVKNYEPSTCALTVTGVSASIAALVTDVAAGICYAFRYGSVAGTTLTYNDMVGVQNILANTTSLFGIDAGANEAWRASQYALNADLTVGGILNAVAYAFARGLDEDLVVFLHPDQWQKVANSTDILSNRRFDSSYKPGEAVTGVESITLHGLNGKVEVKPSPYCKRNVAIGIVPSLWSRVGAVDFTLNDPAGGGQIFYHDPVYSAVAFRGMSHQALVCKQPMRGGLLITGLAK